MALTVVYTDDENCDYTRPSIFLAGPSPRSPEVKSWRGEAVSILNNLGFNGNVFVPEFRNKLPKGQFDFITQVEWEELGLSSATAIVFWVPRDMEKLPGLTTNVEFGRWVSSSPYRCFYGRPTGAPHTNYLDWLFKMLTGRDQHYDMEEMMKDAVEFTVD